MSSEDELAKLAPFSRLSRSELRRLASAVVERKYAAGARIITEGDQAFALFIVKNGKVEACGSMTDPNGRRELPAGSVFGEMALLNDPMKRLATVTAIEDTECLLILRDHLTGLRPPL